MTRNVIVTVATQTTQLATELASGGLIISLINVATGAVEGTPQTVAPGASYSATFANVPAGTYTATAQNVDTSGKPLDAAVTSAPYAVVDLPPATPATFAYDVPVSITIAAQ